MNATYNPHFWVPSRCFSSSEIALHQHISNLNSSSSHMYLSQGHSDRSAIERDQAQHPADLRSRCCSSVLMSAYRCIRGFAVDTSSSACVCASQRLRVDSEMGRFFDGLMTSDCGLVILASRIHCLPGLHQSQGCFSLWTGCPAG